MQLSQIRLIVSDFPTSFRFYRDVLGFTPQVDDERGPYAKLSPPHGDAAVALHARDDLARHLPLGDGPGESAAREDHALLVFKVDDVDRTAADIERRGGALLKQPADAWGRLRVAYLRDPEGNLIELQQWLG